MQSPACGSRAKGGGGDDVHPTVEVLVFWKPHALEPPRQPLRSSDTNQPRPQTARSSKENSKQTTGYGNSAQLSSNITTIRSLLVASVAGQSKEQLKAVSRLKHKGGKLMVARPLQLTDKTELEQAAFQRLNVQVETSSKWCPSRVHTGTSTIR